MREEDFSMKQGTCGHHVLNTYCHNVEEGIMDLLDNVTSVRWTSRAYGISLNTARGWLV